MRIPDPDASAPQGVRLIYPDGSQTDPLPVVFIGYEAHEGARLAVWEVCTPDDRRYDGIAIDVLPSHTSVQIAVGRQ